ncbi:hypothetical protein C7S18_02365 [Ahniella affigens]|uniref:DUF4864 domain-containing protein n=1 Tax=Ahniella affigens TaxID=2021234 RepID=A0A2P1PMQ6_9GAMM|nr:hypothetical protein [Ahniella affigens]AVP96107.1 hypothetical protein C7S18_02365 [Ahniella affigens]
MSRLNTLKVLALSLSLILIGRADAASVNAEFVLNGQSLKPSQVAAFRIRDSFNPREQETYVMLTSEPVDAAAIVADLDPYARAINDPAANADHLNFFVKSNGDVSMNAKVGGTQYLDSSGKIMGQQGGLIAECRQNTKTEVACTVKSAKPTKNDGDSWTVVAEFSAPVQSRPEGTPLAADGGAAGKSFNALAKAIQGDDLTAILALLTATAGADFQRDYNTPEENLAWAKDLLGTRIPKKAKVTGGEQLAADHVLLEVVGEPWEGSKMLYQVEYRHVDGKWLYETSSTVGMLR